MQHKGVGTLLPGRSLWLARLSSSVGTNFERQRCCWCFGVLLQERTMPTPNVTSLERAFQLARSGKCKTTADIQLQLKAEGYSAAQVIMIGPTLMRQLRAVINDKSSLPGSAREL
jgi:hypothetical protein